MTDTAGTSLSMGVGAVRSADSSARARRARLESRAVLVAVCALVFLVSLPRLQGIAIRENELDALRAISLLEGELAVLAALGSAPEAVAELVPEGSLLRRRLADIEVLAGGRLVLRHGYLFQIAELPRPGGPAPALCAWPWQHGSTGVAALVALPGEGILGHRNDHPDPELRWSGPGRPPQLPASAEGWRPVRLPGTRAESH